MTDLKIISSMIKNELGECGICKTRTWAGHSFAQVASIVLHAEPKAAEPRALDVMDASENRRWKILTSHKKWDRDRNNLITYLIACPQAGGILAHIYDPNELYESQHICGTQLLERQDLTNLSALIPSDCWYDLITGARIHWP